MNHNTLQDNTTSKESTKYGKILNYSLICTSLSLSVLRGLVNF